MRMVRKSLRPESSRLGRAVSACGLVFCAFGWIATTHAQVAVPDKGHGSFSTDYQQVLVEDRTDDAGNASALGKVNYRTVHFNVDYGFADRWAVSATLPFGSNRGTGTDHDPSFFSDPHGQHLIDDGRYHGGWKDWTVGVRYQWLTAPILVTPYVKYGFPTHDYQYYGESALGLRQTELQFGVDAGIRFPQPWQNLYVTSELSYSWMQDKGIRRVNHSTFSLDLGYFFTPKFSARAGLAHRWSYNGLDFPAAVLNPDGSLNFDVLFHHDTIRNITFTEVHLDFDYQINDRYTLSVETSRTLDGAANANLIKSAVSIGISRSF
ncbi:MAG: hypothetical protein ABI365_05765 [Lysobacteraceae bacterium]